MTEHVIPGVPFGDAICYSGYRHGQSPASGVFPSHEEVAEDLSILAGAWKYLRLYDCSRHAEIVLDVIADRSFDFRVLLGAEARAEVSNPNCPWGGEHDESTLARNRDFNREEIERAIALAKRHRDAVCAVSIGNEASVEWTDHLVPVESLVESARQLRAGIDLPITFCENYVPWFDHLAPLVPELDFLSVHTYPVWEHQTIEAAIAYTQDNFRRVAERWPDKPVVITEAGWTTRSNGRGIEPWNASQELQAMYVSQLLEWSRRERVTTFVFEAFDEPWKGSPDPHEPEKHWGLYTVDRQPKRVVDERFVGKRAD